MRNCDVAVIGAGPYGLSIAAHLKGMGIDFRIFGRPMHTWLNHMPRGMRLKSEGFASYLYDPGMKFTLADYCKEYGLHYADIGSPVPIETFTAYGLEFQRRFLPELEEKMIVSMKKSSGGFEIKLEDGEVFTARRVVMAVGLTHFEYMPPMLAALAGEFVTHSARHTTFERFKGREVAVIGAGASALDIAALLHQSGVAVHVVARKPAIRFHDPPDTLHPTFWQQLRTPVTGIGPGWKLWWCTNAPFIFRLMPEKFRFEKVKTILGPAPGWFIKDEVVGKMPFHLGVNITAANVKNNRVELQLSGANGVAETLTVDHVISATGYKVDLKRLTFVAPEVLSQIRAVQDTPVLSANFESSVSGLYFIGTSSANTFGPLMRFAFGARFAAKRVSRHLAKSAVRKAAGYSASAEQVEQEAALTR